MGAYTDDAEVQAIRRRDNADKVQLEIVQCMVSAWLEQILWLTPLVHPDTRWHPDDLRNALHGTLADVARDLETIKQPPLVGLQ